MIDAQKHFRIYALANCPLCKKLADIFTEKGIIAGLTIIDSDPVLMRGVASWWEDGVTRAPLLLCSAVLPGINKKKLIIRGLQEERIRELLDAYVAAYSGANAPDAAAAERKSIQPPANMVAESQPVAG